MSTNFDAVFGSCSFALVTPFNGEEDEDQPVDFAAFEALVESKVLAISSTRSGAYAQRNRRSCLPS